MRTYTLFCCLWLCAFHLCSYAQTSTYPNGLQGCLARWDFCSNGTVSSLPDVSNNGHNGTVYNMTATNAFRSIPNNAMNFNGTSSKAVIPHHVSMNPQTLSIIALVKMQGFYSGTCQGNNIIYKSHGYIGTGCWGMYVSDGPHDADCNQFSPNFEQLLFAEPTNGASGTPVYPSSNYVNLNQWYFMAITYDGAYVKYYMVPMDVNNHNTNATFFLNRPFSQVIGNNTYDVMIGATQNGPYPYWFNGDMDEVAVFDRALSPAEVQSVYDYLWQVITIAPPPASMCAGSSFNLNYTVNTSYFSGGNTFTVQLSDASGSFNSPVTIGSVSSTTSGSIPCTIPPSTPLGTGYRIRIVATNSPYIADMESCSTISIGTSGSPPTISSNSPVCEGNTLNLTATNIAGATYNWTGPNGFSSNAQNPIIPNVTLAAGGTYTLNVSVGGCITPSTNVNVFINPQPTAPAANSNSPVCAGTSLALNASPSLPGATYNWIGPNNFSATGQNTTVPSITSAGAGTYLVTVTQGGCTSQPGAASVIVMPEPSFTLGNDTTICDDNSFLLQPLNFTSGTATYLWSNTAITNTISVTTGGTYWLEITDNGCSKTDSINLNFIKTPIVNLGNDTGFCEGTTYTITNQVPVTGSPSYLWNTSATSSSITVNQAGSYWLKIDKQGCIGSDTIELNTIPIPYVSIGNDTFICDGTPITLTSSPQPPNAIYAWSTGSHTSSITVSEKGTYSLAVSVNGCTGSDDIHITEVRKPMIELGEDTTLCLGELLTLPRIISSGSEYEFLWFDGSTKPTFTVDKKGVYSVTLSNICGKTYDTVNVDYKVCTIWFPSGFTPNGDDLNPIAKAKGNLEGITNFRLSIFNRWGNRVYYTEDKYSGWDGTHKGVLQSSGTYMYMIQFDYNGESQIMKGDITLIR